MKEFRESLREHAVEIINFKKKKRKLFRKEQQEPYEKAKMCYICKKKLENNYLKDKTYHKVKYHCRYIGQYIGAAYSICNSKYSVPKKTPRVFNNESNYDYNCIIKELGKEFFKKITYLEENTEKCITFTVPIKKEVTRIDKNGEEITKNISQILQFTDSARFMASSLSNHYQSSLSIIFLKKFIELNVNTDMMIKM